MKDEEKSKEVLIQEICSLRKLLVDLKAGQKINGSAGNVESSAALFHAFMTNSPAVAFMHDTKYRFVYVNAQWEIMFNRKSETVIGKSFVELFPSDIVPLLIESSQLVWNTGMPVRRIEVVPTPDGIARSWLVMKFPFTDTTGEMLVGGMAVDISDRMAAEDLLRKENEVHRIIFDSVPAMIWFKDKENRILRVNETAAEAMGLAKEEIEGQSTYDLYPEEASKYHHDDLEVINSGKPKLGILELFTIPGQGKRWVLTDKVPYYDESGDIIGVIVFAVDVTERRKAEEGLKQAHSQLESKVEERTQELSEANIFFALSLDLFSIISFDGYFKRLNPIWERTLGYTLEELQSRPAVEFIHPADLKKTMEAKTLLQTGADLVRFENRYICKDGSVKWFSWNATVSGDKDLIFAVAHDITERKENEEMVRELNESLEQRVIELAAVNQELQSLTQKLEVAYDQALETSNLKSEFVANTSHEIRTLISGVIGMSELILGTKLSAEQKQLASAIHESGQSLLTIINDILDFSKMEAGKVELEDIDFSPVNLIEGTAELVRLSARAKKLSLMTFIDPSIPAWLKGDPVRLRQVLLNLADNAVKFTDRGEVVIRASLVSCHDGVANVSFSVSDTGIGLSPEGLSKLFKPFTQADGSTTRKYGGTGLGLSICKRLVNLMGGDISVTSKEGEGSNFRFNTKFAISNRESSSVSAQMLVAGYQLKQTRILVIDSSLSSGDIIAEYLASAGLKTQTASDKNEALKSLKEAGRLNRPFHVAIVNLSEEIEDSLKFARTILGDSQISDTKLVLVTSTDEIAGTEQVRKSGFACVLPKPVRQTALVDAVALCMGRNVTQTTLADEMVDTTRIKHLTEARTETGLPTGERKLILLVEDNPVLQSLAVRQLERLGTVVHAAANGKQAVNAVEINQYALIFMDVQMPDMDGYEATMHIRNRGIDTPIIAMTASVMPGDREKCLAAGMNDYLSKPVSLEALKQITERWCQPSYKKDNKPAEAGSSISPDDESSTEILDVDSLQNLYDENALKEILDLFVGEAEDLIAKSQEALKKQDSRQLGMLAHQLKGLSSVVCALEMHKLSISLERTAQGSDWARAANLLTTLAKSYQSMREKILRSK